MKLPASTTPNPMAMPMSISTIGCKAPEKRLASRLASKCSVFQLVEVGHVGGLAVEALHHAHACDVLVVLAVDHGDGATDAHEGMTGELLPVAQDEEEGRNDGETDEGQLPVYYQHHGYDANEAQKIGQTLYDEFEGFL